MDTISDDVLERILELHSFLLKGFEKQSRPEFTEALEDILETRQFRVKPDQLNSCGYYGPSGWVTGPHLTTAEIKYITDKINFSLPSRRRKQSRVPEATTGYTTADATTEPKKEHTINKISTTPTKSPPQTILTRSQPSFTEIR
jgi:hypothetical protein